MNVVKSYYLALDPGDTTGWAQFEEDGKGVTFDSFYGKEKLYEFLDAAAPQVIICEDYKLFPWKAANQSWSRLDTVRAIGAIEYWAYLHNAKVIFQDPKIKSIGYMWAGIPKPKNHSESHHVDAYVHGVYFLQKAGIRKPQQGRSQ